MINERRGISEINKIESELIFDLFKLVGFKMNNDYNFNGINIKINFKVGDYYANVMESNKLYILNFVFPIKHDNDKVKEIITHELNHLIEIMSIFKKNYTLPVYNDIKKSLLKFNPITDEMQFFKQAIYKTLDNEINANVAQTYTYLKKFNVSNRQFLTEKLEEYEKRIGYKTLKNYNTNKLIDDIKNKSDVYKELIILNDLFLLNGVDRFLNFLYGVKNIDSYINNWFKLIRINIDKFLRKQDNIIKEIIEDTYNGYNSEYPISESILLKYNEYLKK